METKEAEQSLFAVYEQLRERCAKQHEAIIECLTLLDMEAGRREREGRDSLSIAQFTARIRKELAA